MQQIWTPEEASKITDAATLISRAQIFQGNTDHPRQAVGFTYALDTALTIGLNTSQAQSKIAFPWRSVYVASATDISVQVKIRMGTMDSYEYDVPLKQGDALNSSIPVSESYLSWTAQSGKTITLVFFPNAEFKNGSQVSVSNGSVTIGYGSTVALGAQVTLAAATAALIAPALATRKQATIQNNSGASIWIGDSTVTNSGATQGLEIVNKGFIYWQNTAGLYGYSVGGGVVNRMEEA